MTGISRYQYPMVRGSGPFLVCIGLGLVLGTALSGAAPVNMRILGISAILAVAAMIVGRRMSPLGRPTRFHILAMIGAIALEFLMFGLVFRHLPQGTTVETRWFWALFLVGLHFIPMGWSLGRRAVYLGVACAAVAASGLFLGLLPFTYVAVLDGLLKAGFGLSLATTRAQAINAEPSA